jgi:peptidoglycan/xylan/chitin deacetylase (PgdA/CDA1 family)
MILAVKKFFIENFIFESPIFDVLRTKLFSNNVIIMYHGIDTKGTNPYNQRHTGVKDFEKHIIFLKKKCNIISVKDYFEEKFIKNKINVAITFDDGYLNNYTNAFPILEKYKVPATFYCTGLNKTEDDILWADFLNIASTLTDKELEIEGEIFIKKKSVYTSSRTGKNIYETVKNVKPDYSFKQSIYDSLSFLTFKNDSKYDEYWKLMSDEQIKEISNSNYVTIGSHGFYHNNLGNISTENAKKEIEDSVNYLQNLTQKTIDSIAFPDGSYNKHVLDICEQYGLKYQMTTENYISETDKADDRILTRKGVYATAKALEQLYQTLKK